MKARGLELQLGEVYGSLRIPGFWHQIRSQGAFPGGSDDKESVCSAGDLDLIPGSGRSPGEVNGTLLHYSCLENPMDREAWQDS